MWGLIGALTFLVLLQGVRLFVGSVDLGIVPTVGIGFAIGGFVTVLSFVLEPRLAAKGRS
nr:hypothetical protein [Halobellus ruber]